MIAVLDVVRVLLVAATAVVFLTTMRRLAWDRTDAERLLILAVGALLLGETVTGIEVLGSPPVWSRLVGQVAGVGLVVAWLRQDHVEARARG